MLSHISRKKINTPRTLTKLSRKINSGKARSLGKTRVEAFTLAGKHSRYFCNSNNNNNNKISLPNFANRNELIMHHKTMKALSKYVIQKHSRGLFKYYYHYIDLKTRDNNDILMNKFKLYRDSKDFVTSKNYIKDFYKTFDELTKNNIFDVYLNTNKNDDLKLELVKRKCYIDRVLELEKCFYDNPLFSACLHDNNKKAFCELDKLKKKKEYYFSDLWTDCDFDDKKKKYFYKQMEIDDEKILNNDKINDISLNRIISNCNDFRSMELPEIYRQQLNVISYATIPEHSIWKFGDDEYYFNFKPIFCYDEPFKSIPTKSYNVFYIHEHDSVISNINEINLLVSSHCLWKKFETTMEKMPGTFTGYKEINHFHLVKSFYENKLLRNEQIKNRQILSKIKEIDNFF